MDYYFDEDAAERPVRFIETLCTHVKGKWAGKPLILEDWQKDEIIRPLFGWRRPDGLRKYKQCYLEIPRKNAKTTIGAAIALYLLFVDGEKGGEVYSAASEREQAKICFDIASGMCLNNEDLSNNCEVLLKSITHAIKEDGKTFKNEYKAISAESKSKHGYNPSGLIIDELHTHKNRDLYDTLIQGTGAREQPLTIIITTAGIKDMTTIGWEVHEYARQIIDGSLEDEEFLAIIYGASEDDDPYSEETWKKANPNYGISLMPHYMKGEAKKAAASAAYLNIFKRYHLNIWTGSESKWMEDINWMKCAEEPVMEGDAILSLDLASKRDFTCLMDTRKNKDGYYSIEPYFFIPQDSISGRKNEAQIRAWVDQGYIIATPGEITDYNYIKDIIKNIGVNILEVAYDPYNATHLSIELLEEGIEMVEFRQGWKTMSPAIKELDGLVGTQKLRHGGNPVLRWMASNVIIIDDGKDNMQPDKGKSSDKIDGIIATCMGISRWLLGHRETKTGSYYESGEFKL